MDSDKIVNLYYNRLDEHVKDLQRLSDLKDKWVEIVKTGLFPELPEAAHLFFSYFGDRINIILPLNKIMFSEVGASFEEVGWHGRNWRVQAWGASIDYTHPNYEGLEVHIDATGRAVNCKLVKIAEKEEIYRSAVYELTCENAEAI